MSLSDLSADAVPVQRVPRGDGETVDARVDAAREAHRRASEQLRVAQEAARVARLARQKAHAMDERVTLLEARFLVRWERRRVAPDRGADDLGPVQRGLRHQRSGIGRA